MPNIKQPMAFKLGLGGTIAGLMLAGICAGALFLQQDRSWIGQDFGESSTGYGYLVAVFGGFSLLISGGGIYTLLRSFREPSDPTGEYGSKQSFDSREKEMEAELKGSRV